MVRRTPMLLLAPLLVAASAPVMTEAGSLDAALRQARSEQAAAEADAQQLQSAARNARS